jgi:pimeloyl-ACP methyl ester carboxylesterase
MDFNPGVFKEISKTKLNSMEENKMKSFAVFFTILLIFSTTLSFGQSQSTDPADITIDRNGVLLKGKFYSAEGTGFFATVLLLQGFPGNETDVIGMGKLISQSGINVLTFNYSGTFQSQGKSNFDNTQMDIKAAFEFLHNPENIKKLKIDTALIVLGGWSYGGGMAMTYSIRHPEITLVFTIAGVDWGEYYEEYLRNPVFRKITDDSMARLATSAGPVRLDEKAMPDEITKGGIIRLDSAYFLRKSARLLAQKDILIIGGWDDPQATVDQFILPLYRSIKREKAQNVRIMAFQDGHSFSKTRPELAAAIVKWIKTIPERKVK